MRKFLILFITALTGCKIADPVLTSKEDGRVVTAVSENGQYVTSPPLIIYQTKADYSSFVPVGLDNQKKTVVSYPGPGDVYSNGVLAIPTRLAGGFFLDNRGIGLHTAFTDITYEDYSKYASALSPDEFSDHIADADPFLSMYSYDGTRDTATINALIRDGPEKHFKKLK